MFPPQIMNLNRGFHYFHHPFWVPRFWKHPFLDTFVRDPHFIHSTGSLTCDLSDLSWIRGSDDRSDDRSRFPSTSRYLEDGPSLRIITRLVKGFFQPFVTTSTRSLGDLLIMVINHLLNGMILQVYTTSRYRFTWSSGSRDRRFVKVLELIPC